MRAKSVIELASRKLIRFIAKLRGIELAMIISAHARNSRALRFWPESWECTAIDGDEIPWFVVWLASLHSVKHRYTMRKIPDCAQLRSDLSNFVKKVNWACYFERQAGGTTKPIAKITRPTLSFNQVEEPELKAWSSAVRSKLVRSKLLTAMVAANSRGGIFNTSEPFVWALSRLRISWWAMLRNDKEGSWSIMPKDRCEDLFANVLQGSNYIEWSFNSDMDSVAKSLCKRLSLEDERWPMAVSKSERSSKVAAKLMVLVKSHESPVSLRAVHSLPCFRFEAFSRWLMTKLRSRLAGLRHLVKSSSQVVREVDKIKVHAKCFFVKMDVKDFYVVGQAHVIAASIARLFDDTVESSQVFDIAFFLMDNQYVQHGGKLYKVVEGTGIGLLHSGDIADACYYEMVERHVAFSEFGVFYHARFRDDMLFLGCDATKLRLLNDKMNRLGDFFKLEIEDVSTVGLRYLDIFIRRDGSNLSCSPFFKDPCLQRRLSCESAHQRSTHTSWPQMMVNRLVSLSSTEEMRELVVKEMLTRLRADGCFVPQTKVLRLSRVCTAKQPSKPCRVLWLPMPFHPWWYRLLKRAVGRINNDPSLRNLFSAAFESELPFQLRVSWKNYLPANGSLLRHRA